MRNGGSSFALALAVEMAEQLKPLSQGELLRWAQLSARANGTHTGGEDSIAPGTRARLRRLPSPPSAAASETEEG